MNVQRYVNIGFVVVGVVAWAVMARFFGTVLEWIDLDAPLIGADFMRSDLLGLVSGVAVGVALKLHAPLNEWGIEVGNELKKVSWPTWEETKLSTVVVVVVSIIVAVILAVFDTVWAAVSTFIYGLG
jgi:preprotein translocase subunit SecE